MKNIKNKFFVIGLIIVCFLSLSGCNNGQELHRQLIVQGIAIDKDATGYTITLQAFDFQTPKDENEPTIRTIEVKGETLWSALENVGKKTSLNPVYSQNSVIIMGEEVAKMGANNFIDFFIRHCETRPKVKLCVSKGECAKILKTMHDGKPIQAQIIHDLIPDLLNSDILHFVGNICGNISDPSVAWLDVSDGEIILKGVGMFDKDKLVTFLDGEDAFGFIAMKGVPHFGTHALKTEKFGEITSSIDKIKVSVSPIISEDMQYPKFNISLNIEASAFSFDKKPDYNFDNECIEEINSMYEEEFKKIFSNVVKHTVRQKLDAFDFGKILRNKYPNYFKSIRDNWKNIIQNCEYTINQNVSVKVTGKEPL